MTILWIIYILGQIVNLSKFLKINSLKSYPGLNDDLHSHNTIIRMMAEQHLSVVQTRAFSRLFGLFMGYGAIWGWIDIVKYFRGFKG